MERSKITIAYDFICPWCWIGHRNLEAGKALDELPELDVRYLPFELNPEIPPQGMHRRAYRRLEFGSWTRSEMLGERDFAVTRRYLNLTRSLKIS
ncbi:DsbA family protein [Paraburkholderia sp. CI3]|uniref:DsbA family protein n=1 Tax=Paraburkholderia sp. CI3 TaxID=2991060 RepID=UPI003D24A0AE